MLNKKAVATWGGALMVLNALALALIARKSAPWLTSDSGQYLALASGLRTAGHFGLQTPVGFQPEAWRQPGYPAFVAVIQALAGPRNLWVVVVQAALYLATLAFLARTVGKKLGAPAALALLALAAVYPFFAFGASQIGTEALAIPLVVVGVTILPGENAAACALAGALLGAATLVRPNLVLLPFLLVCFFAVTCWRTRQVRGLLVAALVAVAVDAGWAARNLHAFGKFSPLPVASGAGTGLLMGTWESRVGVAGVEAPADYGSYTPEDRRAGLPEQLLLANSFAGLNAGASIAGGLEVAPTNQQKLAVDKISKMLAVKNMRTHPFAYAHYAAFNTVRIWVPLDSILRPLPRTAKFVSSWQRPILLASSVGAFLLGVIGLVTADWNSAIIQAFGLTIGYFSLTLCWFETEGRYTLPARLFFLTFSALGALWLLSRLARLRSRAHEQSPRATAQSGGSIA